MRNKSIFTLWLVGMLVVSIMGLLLSTEFVTQQAKGAEPILEEPSAYDEYDEYYGGWNVVFEVIYKDLDGDEGDVTLFYNNEQEIPMTTDLNIDPIDGRYYYAYIDPSTVVDDDSFYFYAEDTNGDFTYLGSSDNPFLVGDELGWGEKPILSEPYVYYDDDSSDYVFGVTYQDLENDAGYLTVNVGNETEWKSYDMSHTEGDPINGENFEVNVPDTEIDDDWEFRFEAWDERESRALLPDQDQNLFVIVDVLGSNGESNGNGDGDGSSQGFALPEWLNNAEVVVGIIGLVAIGAGSAYGVLRRKKKHGRFSELLTQLDEVYGSFKLNPKRCETELEKMRATINEDLKKSTIDENNYTILKTRIDEILGEIRSESMKSEVAELPKDIEIKIKDMLIDGEITREEYDKLLPIIKGSDMASDDKEKMKKMVGSWVKEDKSG